MEIRQITRDEVPEFIRLAQYAFGTYTDEPPSTESVERQPLRGTLAAFDDGLMASRLYTHRFLQSVRGEIRPMGGVGGVATAPEFRGRGMVRSLMNEAFAWMRDEGLSVSMLRPFKEAFYERLGYVRTACSFSYTIGTPTFAEYAGRERSTGLRMERVECERAQERYFAAMQTSFRHVHGRVLHEDLSPEGWRSRFKDGLFLFVSRDSATTGMMSYTKEGFLSEGRISAQDFFWTDDDSLRAMFGFLALHRDQISTVTVTLPISVNIAQLVPRIGKPFSASIQGAPWMVRIVDVEHALTGLPAPGGGRIVADVSDPVCPWNTGRFLLDAESGRLSVSKSTENATCTVDVTALSALLYGAMPVEQAVREFGLKADRDALDRLDAWFPERALFNDYWF